MSWRASAYVAEITSGITRSEKLVLLILANRHNDDTGRCDASIPRIARETLLGERRLQYVLQSLQVKGLIVIERRAGATNQYTICALQRTPAVIAGVTPAVLKQTPAILDTGGALPVRGNRKVEPQDLEPDPTPTARANVIDFPEHAPPGTALSLHKQFFPLQHAQGRPLPPGKLGMLDVYDAAHPKPCLVWAYREGALQAEPSERYTDRILKSCTSEGHGPREKPNGRATNGRASAGGRNGRDDESADRKKQAAARARGGKW